MDREKEMEISIPKDNDLIFVRSEIDDLGLSLGAFRVYGHLSRRQGNNEFAWPSYNSIGEKCFRGSYPKAKSTTLRRKAIDAVKELKEAGLIIVETRKIENTSGNKSNEYRLLKLNAWLSKQKKHDLHPKK